MATPVATTPIAITNGSLEAELNSGLPLLMLVWRGESIRSDLKTALDKVAKENAGKLRVLKVDVSAVPEAEERFSLGKKPLLIGWYNGEVIARRNRPWGTDATGIASDLLALVPAGEAGEENEDAPQDSGDVPTDTPVHVTDETFMELVVESPLPVVVDFWAEWCGPCKMIAPVLEKLAKEYAGQIRIAKVDVDANPMLSQQFQIRSIPTLMFVKNGKIVGQSAGAAPEPALRDVIGQLLALEV